MPIAPWLTVVVTDIGVAPSQELQVNSLARLAGRGTLTYRWPRDRADAPLRSWQYGLIEALGVEAHTLASAPLSASPDADGYWLHAQPVHFAAGLDRLSFLSLSGEARIDVGERRALFATLVAGFSSGDFVLHSKDDEWFIRSPRVLQVVTSTPEAAASNDLHRVMPHGADAPAVRRLMTEIQMLMHEHPVNELRARRGLPAINAIWLWGGGMIPAPMAISRLPAAFGDDPFVRGLYGLCGEISQPAADGPAELLNSIGSEQRAIVVMPVEDLQILDSRWLVPFSRALAQGRLSRLDLILDGWRLDVRRADLRRFWRRDLPPSQWQGIS